MNEEFITKAIENDRYLKATRLVDRFESDVVRELKNTHKSLIEDNEELFMDDTSLSKNITSRSSLATIRVDSYLRNVEPDVEDSQHLRLNIALEWMEPEERGEQKPGGGTLSVVHYKIKGGPREDYDRVKRMTKESDEWDIRFGDDIWKRDRGVFYIPIEDATDMEDGLETLSEHFSEYGDEFGVSPDI
jgi:hypothetical protein